MGTYLLIMGCLNNFSDKARVALSVNDSLGNRLINGGSIGASLFSANLIRQLYQTNQSSWHELYIITLVGCLIVIAVGAFLIWRSYLRSQRATKV